MNIWRNLPKGFTVLAPMEGVTDVVFRQVINRAGRPDLFIQNLRMLLLLRLKKADMMPWSACQFVRRMRRSLLRFGEEILNILQFLRQSLKVLVFRGLILIWVVRIVTSIKRAVVRR